MDKKLKAMDFRLFVGCPCVITGNAYRSTIDVIDAALNRVVVSGGVDYEPFLIKPILRRFESLSRFEVEQLNKLWPHESIKRTAFGSIQLDAEIINYLTLLHVDVFGWIDQGLAVDAEYNTVGSNE